MEGKEIAPLTLVPGLELRYNVTTPQSQCFAGENDLLSPNTGSALACQTCNINVNSYELFGYNFQINSS